MPGSFAADIGRSVASLPQVDHTDERLRAKGYARQTGCCSGADPRAVGRVQPVLPRVPEVDPRPGWPTSSEWDRSRLPSRPKPLNTTFELGHGGRRVLFWGGSPKAAHHTGCYRGCLLVTLHVGERPAGPHALEPNRPKPWVSLQHHDGSPTVIQAESSQFSIELNPWNPQLRDDFGIDVPCLSYVAWEE